MMISPTGSTSVRSQTPAQSAPSTSAVVTTEGGLTVTGAPAGSSQPEKYGFAKPLQRENAPFAMDSEQAASLPLRDNHVSEHAQSVRELLRYQLDMINTATLALVTGNTGLADEMDGARRATTGGYQPLESELYVPQLKKLTQEIGDAMTHLEQDRNASPAELRTAGSLRGKLIDLIAGEYRRHGLSYCQAKRLVSL